MANKSIDERAEELLRKARTLNKGVKNWMDLHNAIFGIGGLSTQMFPTDSERVAFCKTDEHRKIWNMIESHMEEGGIFAEKLTTANGALSLRVPRSVHAALLEEANAEGVSLNQLCLAKLSVQLRSAVC